MSGLAARQPLLRLLAPLGLMGAIFFFSAQPYDGHEMAWWEMVGRNLGHFGGYALLAAAWCWALWGRVRNALAWAAILALTYAAVDEYHQTFVEGRTGTWEDVVLDGLGIAAALLAIRIRASRRRRGSAEPHAAEA
ncbi:MAG: VanZ family protein [Solirubrobacterales bacterium]